MKLAVIGGGPGGYVAALKAAQLGAEVTLIEKEKVGGTCLNWGCIPTKALLASSEVYSTIKEAKEYGVNITGDIEADFGYMINRKNKTVDSLVKGIEFLLEKRNVKRVNGFGKLISKNSVRVIKPDDNTEDFEFDKIILATGSVPVVPGFIPFDGDKIITSDEALNLDSIPDSLTIVGGGVIGCEFGQFFARLGTKVTIVEMSSHVLPFEDEDVAKQLQRQFKKDKIKVIGNDKIDSIKIEDNKVISVLGSGKSIESDKMLVSVGRKAFFEKLGLEELGINVEKGKIVVDESLKTSIDTIYAIGDLIDTPFLAHVASKEGVVAAENALGKNKKINYKAVPRCVYTDPEVAGVGITEKQAKEKGINYKVGQFDFRGLGKAQAIGKIQGFVKIIVDQDDKIIGSSVVGPHATDLLTELSLAVHLGLTAEQVGDVIHAHPTLSEALMEALHDVHGQCVHSI